LSEAASSSNRRRLAWSNFCAGLGAEVARAVARKLVVYYRRAGGQSQFSALLELEPKSDRIQSALAFAKRNLDKPLTVRQLAGAAHLSPRQFSRAFRAKTGQSPARRSRTCGSRPPG
jgi:transcriptional regulator GlxA family with amidase domain